MVILLSSHSNAPIRAIYLLLLTKTKKILFLLYNRNNCYTRDGQAIPVVNKARIYSTIKDLSVGEVRVIEETGRFTILPLRSRTHWHGLKRRGTLNVRNLQASLQSSTFNFFTNKMMEYL